MKTTRSILAAALLAAGALAFLAPAQSQTASKEPEVDVKALSALVTEVQTQQQTIADNQAKIDEKVAAIAEQVRQARIYSSRGR